MSTTGKKQEDGVTGSPLLRNFTYSQEILLAQEKIIVEKLSPCFYFCGKYMLTCWKVLVFPAMAMIGVLLDRDITNMFISTAQELVYG